MCKIVNFPDSSEITEKRRIQLLEDKLDSAIGLLSDLTSKGIDFHIVLDGQKCTEIGELDNINTKYLIVSSNYDEIKNLNINSNNSSVYILKGNELNNRRY